MYYKDKCWNCLAAWYPSHREILNVKGFPATPERRTALSSLQPPAEMLSLCVSDGPELSHELSVSPLAHYAHYAAASSSVLGGLEVAAAPPAQEVRCSMP
jgi:hypothetical protein